MKEIDDILVELQDTWGYTIEEQNHIHDLIVEYSHDLCMNQDMQDRAMETELRDI